MTVPRADVDVVPPAEGLPRRCHMSDVMILVAAIAVGLALGKTAFAGSYPRRVHPGYQRIYAVQAAHAAACPCIASLNVACILLRLKRPRPAFRRMMQQPGVAASCMSVVQLLIAGLGTAYEAPETSLANFTVFLSPYLAMGVVLVWHSLWLNEWGKPEPGWIDRMGRVLGLCWIVSPFIYFFSFWL